MTALLAISGLVVAIAAIALLIMVSMQSSTPTVSQRQRVRRVEHETSRIGREMHDRAVRAVAEMLDESRRRRGRG